MKQRRLATWLVLGSTGVWLTILGRAGDAQAWVPTPLLATSASAAGSALRNDALAVELFLQARMLYDKGEYYLAITKLKQALKLDPEAKDLFYNLALIYEKVGKLEEAEHNYQQFLKYEKDPKERARVTVMLERVRGAQKILVTPVSSRPVDPQKKQVGTKKVPESKAPPTGRKRGKLDGWVIGSGSVAVLGLISGAYFGVRALADRPSNPTTGAGTTIHDLQDKQDSARQSALIADVSLGIGVVAGALASYLYFSRSVETPSPVKVGIQAQPSSLFGRFEVAF
jgi:tetratricopeptide (TPR) repeat protein